MLLLLLLSRLSRVRLCAAHRAPVPGILQRRTPGWVAIASSGRGARKTKPAEFHPPSRPALWSRLHRTPGTPQPAGTTGQNLASRVPRPRRHTVERGGVLTVGEWPEGGKGGLAPITRGRLARDLGKSVSTCHGTISFFIVFLLHSSSCKLHEDMNVES